MSPICSCGATLNREEEVLIHGLGGHELVGADSTMKVHYLSKTVEWGTPQRLFDELDQEFGFTLDVCATKDNAKCPKFYDKEADGLRQNWQGVCWMNPPYGRDIGRWIQKAAESHATVVCLVPCRTDTFWWHRYVLMASEIRFLRGRLRFHGAGDGAPFPSCLVIYRNEFPAQPTPDEVTS